MAGAASRDCLRKLRRAVMLLVELFDMRSCFRRRYPRYTFAVLIRHSPLGAAYEFFMGFARKLYGYDTALLFVE